MQQQSERSVKKQTTRPTEGERIARLTCCRVTHTLVRPLQKGIGMVGKRQAPRYCTVQCLVMLLVTVTGAASVFAQSSSSPASLPLLPPQPLLSEQRSARAEYWWSRHGLQFGVPPRAYEAAVTERYVMEASPADAATSSLGGPRVRPTWQFIGPQPMLNALPNFGGPIPGATFNATGRISALAADPSTPGRLFVGAANGGVWMSTDGGSTFTPIGDALPTQAIGAIVLDP